MRLRSKAHGLTIVEIMVTTVLVGVVGLIIFSLLNIATILGAKNSAVNTAHQQARTAMQQMIQDLHSSVSLPALTDRNGVPLPPIQDPDFPDDPTKTIPNPGPAAGIAFQLYAIGPLQVVETAPTGQKRVDVRVPTGNAIPVAGQRLIVPTHQIEDDITAVSSLGNLIYRVTLTNNLAVPINTNGAAFYGSYDGDDDDDGETYNIVCFVTDRCSYTVNAETKELRFQGPTTGRNYAVMGNDITNATPFSTPKTPAGALYYRFVAAIDLSTADTKYSNRDFKSANILLNGQVPMRARLTAYQ